MPTKMGRKRIPNKAREIRDLSLNLCHILGPKKMIKPRMVRGVESLADW